MERDVGGLQLFEEVACGSTCVVYRGRLEGELVAVKVTPVRGARGIEVRDQSEAERAAYVRAARRFDEFARTQDCLVRLLLLEERTGCPQGELCRVAVSAPLLEASLLFHLEEGPRLRGAELLSAFAGLLRGFLALQAGGWLHGDLHAGNLMYRRTSSSSFLLDGLPVPSFGREWFVIDYDAVLPQEPPQGPPQGPMPPAEEFARTNPHFWLLHFFFQVLYEGPPPDREVLGNDLLMEALCSDPCTAYLRELLPDSTEAATLRIGLEVLALLFEPAAYARLLGARQVPPPDPLLRDAAVFAVQHFHDLPSVCTYLARALAPLAQ